MYIYFMQLLVTFKYYKMVNLRVIIFFILIEYLFNYLYF